LTNDVPAERSSYEQRISELTSQVTALETELSLSRLALDEAKENNLQLERTSQDNDRAIKKKVNSLEKNLEQLTLMYQQLA
jgi:predicted phage gp36 major capsid-like protein